MRTAAATSPMKMPYIPELDGIRAVAILIVFLSHAGLGKVVPGGLGVTIFFFLSGYLITSLMRAEVQEKGRLNFAGFYMRRTLRIFPPLYLTLAFAGLLVATGIMPTVVDLPSIAAQILFVSNYAKLAGFDAGLPGPPLWSLAVEEHFYLIFPAVYGLLLMRMPPRRAALFCAIACLVPLGLRLWQAAVFADGIKYNYFLSHTRIDSILFGSVLALWNNPVLDRETAWRPKMGDAIIGGLIVIGAALVRDSWFGDTWRYSIQGVGLLVVFSFVIRGHPLTSAVLNHPAMQLIGRYSYTLYLVHWLFLSLIALYAPKLNLVLVGVGAAGLAMAYSAAMYHWVEKPLAQVRKRLHKEPVGTATGLQPETSTV